MISFWKCEGYGWLWRVAARGRLIYMICMQEDDDLDGLSGVRMTGRILFPEGCFRTRIVFVRRDAEKTFIAWAWRLREKALKRDATGFADYCETVWECL